MTNQINKSLFLFVVLALIVGFANASQSIFEVSGWVTKEDRSVRRATVSVYKNGELYKETRSNRWGNFRLDLETNSEYKMVVEAEGAIPKNVLIRTYVGEEVCEAADYYLEFIVDIFDINNAVESAFMIHKLVFDNTINDFHYFQPNVSEFLLLENENSCGKEELICQKQG